MPKMLVNVDRFTWPTADGKGLAVANRGEIVDLPDAEAKRGAAIVTTNHYGSGSQAVVREEPALIPARDADKHAESARQAIDEARAAALMRELSDVASRVGRDRMAEIAGDIDPPSEPPSAAKSKAEPATPPAAKA